MLLTLLKVSFVSTHIARNSASRQIHGLHNIQAFTMCDALRDLVAFLQLKKREKQSCRSATFSKVAALNLAKSVTPPWVLFTFFKL